MNENELENFINQQKPSSWGDVEERTVNGRTAKSISASKRPNVENSLNKMIDAARARERRWDKKKSESL